MTSKRSAQKVASQRASIVMLASLCTAEAASRLEIG